MNLLDRLLAIIPRAARHTPPRYAERMRMADKWRAYLHKPNVTPKWRREKGA